MLSSPALLPPRSERVALSNGLIGGFTGCPPLLVSPWLMRDACYGGRAAGTGTFTGRLPRWPDGLPKMEGTGGPALAPGLMFAAFYRAVSPTAGCVHVGDVLGCTPAGRARGVGTGVNGRETRRPMTTRGAPCRVGFGVVRAPPAEMLGRADRK